MTPIWMVLYAIAFMIGGTVLWLNGFRHGRRSAPTALRPSQEVIVQTINGRVSTFICQRCHEAVLPITRCACMLTKQEPLL